MTASANATATASLALAHSLLDRLGIAFDAAVARTASLCAREGKLDSARLDEHQWICYELALANADLLAGKTLVQLTSGSPADARAGLEWAKAHGVDYLDAAILAYPGFVATDDATVCYAGSRAVFDRHLTTLQAIARNSVYVDETIGSAATW